MHQNPLIEEVEKLESVKPIKKTRDYWHTLGPGLTTGASDDDPSGIATYSQTGAQYGFQLLWLSIVTFPLMSIVQEMCARIGIVTGRGLAGNIRKHFSKRLLYISTLLLFGANAFNIGANLGAMAEAVQLIQPAMNYVFLVVGFVALSLLLQIFLPYARYARYLKWLALVLLAYIASTLLANLNWGEVLEKAVTPSISFNKDQILLICAILGTTISPYLFFWQTSQEVEERALEGRTDVMKKHSPDPHAISRMRVDVWSGMLLSNIVMFFIIAAAGALLFSQGITNIDSAAQAAEALRPAFYGVLIFSMLIGLAINFIGIDPIKALIYSAIANGIVAPVVLAFIVLLSSNQRIMGRWVNKRTTTVVGWSVTSIMALAGTAAILAIFV